MDFDTTLSSFVPLIDQAKAAFATDFRYAEAMAKQAGAFQKPAATDRRVLLPAA